MALKQKHKTFGKSKQKKPLQLPLLESLTRCKLKNRETPSAAAAITSETDPNFDDPYDFVDSQSLQPTSPKTPRTSVVSPPASSGKGYSRTPRSSKKQQRTPKTPAEVKMDQLRQKEKDDLERALEESRKEAEKEQRRRRRERREAAEAMEERGGVIENISIISKEDAPSDISTAQSLAEVTVEHEHTLLPEENSEHLSQSTPPLIVEDSGLNQRSTPPLNGGREYSSGVKLHVKSQSLSRTPVLQVTKISHRFENTAKDNISPGGVSAVMRDASGVGGEDKDEWLADTPPLMSGEDKRGEGDGTEGDRILQTSTERVLKHSQSEATNSHQASESCTHRKRRQSLLLSLRKGKRRLSSELDSELEQHQLCKKTRIEQDEKTVTSYPPLSDNNEEANSNTISGSDKQGSIQQTNVHLLPSQQTTVKSVKVSVPHTRMELPEMFAPDGVSPGHYTSTILKVFNSYIHQLRVAQSKIMFRVPWSTPIPSHHHQPLTTLTYYSTPPHRHSRSNDVRRDWPIIDLETGEISRISPQSRKTTTRMGTRRSKRRAAFVDEDDDDDLLKSVFTTPSRRSNLSQKDKRLDKDTTSESQWFVPPVNLLSVTRSRSVSVPAHSTTPDPPLNTSPLISDSGPHNTLPPQQDQDSEHSNTCAVDPSSNSTTAVDPSSNSTTAVDPSSNSTTAVDPSSNSTTAVTAVEQVSDSTTTAVVVHELLSSTALTTSDVNALNHQQLSSDVVPCVGREPESENDREERLANHMASSEDESVGERFSRKPKKRGAHILDDSDSETEDNDVVIAKNRTVAGVETEKPESFFANARETFGSGKNLKRYSFKKLSVKTVKYSKPCQLISEGGSKAVIDLTTDGPLNSTNQTPPFHSPPLSRVFDRTNNFQNQPVILDQEAEDMVPCPLCNKSFMASTIESHAANCQESPSPVLNHPLRQASLLTPRFNRKRHVLSSSSPSHSPDPPFSSSLQQQEEDYAELESDRDEIERPVEEESCGSSVPGPLQVYEREDGGYQVDPSTISSSPIKTFRRISDLDPTERAGFYNQFTKKTRGSRTQSARGRVTMETNTTGDYISSRRGRGKGKGRRGGRRGHGKRNYFRGRGRKN